MTEMTSEQRVTELQKKREWVMVRLPSARKEYLEARAEKNFLEKKLEQIDEEINSIKQGQLCLGDTVSA